MAPAISPTQQCQRPDCTGAISDGYCDCCGMAQRLPAPAGGSPGDSPGDSPQLFSQTGLSQRLSPSLDSAILGNKTSPIEQSTRVSRPSDRTALGFGLISLPELPCKQPDAQVLEHPEVPENKRFCGHCDTRVRRKQGFCSQCGARYSFIPSLAPGDKIGGQYEVKGAIAYGGLGWIYLAFDQLLSRYVVLKGLLNSEDPSSAAVALAERQFLAAVKHPNIVNIYNFVTHGGEGFIVMEYVTGQTIRDLRRTRGPLPVAAAIAYIHRSLKAFAYLHNQGLVYCDFKPDNLMLEEGDIKLIDLGAVRRLDDPSGDIYGTLGYSAPEAGEGPTVQSDLFTIGRTLAVLVAQIPDFNTLHQFTLPGPEKLPLFGKYQSLYRFLCRATAKQPEHRFQSAEEMSEQLLGVMRQVVALETGQSLPFTSQHFGADPLSLTLPTAEMSLESIGAVLPLTLVEPSDPAYGTIMNALALSDPGQRKIQLQALQRQEPNSVALRLSLIQLCIEEARSWAEADPQHLASQGDNPRNSSNSNSNSNSNSLNPHQDEPFEAIVQQLRSLMVIPTVSTSRNLAWRASWLWGQLRLLQQQPGVALLYFEKVYEHLPGELSPQLSLALVHEQLQDFAIAQEFYYRVWQTDSTYLSAAFGLARCCDAQGNKLQAMQVLAQIPATAPLYSQARLLIIQLLLREPSAPTEALSSSTDLKNAAQLIEDLPVLQRPRCAQQLFDQALNQLEAGHLTAEPTTQVLNYALEARSLRRGLEQSLRDQARAATGATKINLVDQANRVRTRTWF